MAFNVNMIIIVGVKTDHPKYIKINVCFYLHKKILELKCIFKTTLSKLVDKK